MTIGDVIIIIALVIAAIAAGLFFLNRYVSKKMSEQNAVLERNKQAVSIFVIDKKREKPINVNFPKALLAQMPKLFANHKTYLVMAKIGPQIMTLLCEKKTYEILQPKKSYKIDLAGIFIVGVKGAKPPQKTKTSKIAEIKLKVKNLKNNK